MYSIIHKRFCAFVDLLKRESNETQGGIASKIEVTPQYLSNVMNGKPVSDNTLEKLISVYPDAKQYIFGSDSETLDKPNFSIIKLISKRKLKPVGYPVRHRGQASDLVAFEVDDELMENDTYLSIRENDILIAKNIPKEGWQSIWESRFYVFHHKTLGHMCRLLESKEKNFFRLTNTNKVFSNTSIVEVSQLAEIFLVQELHTRRFKEEKFVTI